MAVLNELLARASVTSDVHAPAVRIGEPYVALINLSLPRRTNGADAKDRQVDLVRRGEVVYLTSAEAQLFLRADPDKDGRQIAVIQKLHGPESRRETQFLLPRMLSGRQFGPPVHSRPDPAGSSFVTPMSPVIPEATPPVPGSEAAPQVDAIDLPPTRASVVAGADMDLVNAVKATLPPTRAGSQ
jgi:hypothetical protein